VEAAAPALSTAARWRAELQRGRRELEEEFRSNHLHYGLLKRLEKLTDHILCSICRELGLPDSLCLMAVGGYGRGELFPHSDIDVLILVPDEMPAEHAQQIERFLSVLWDVGLEIGHSVRTIDDCLREMANDVTVATTLLENRYLIGSMALGRRFRKAFRSALDPIAFMHAKLLEQQQRHVRFHDAAYNLEPNVKESPGGLRDLQTILWIARAAGLGRRWPTLQAHGLITRDEAQQLIRHEHFLANLRIRLHYLARRREDRLVFDLQNQLANELGLRETRHRRASELLMQRYYRTVKAVRQLNTILLQNLRATLAPSRAEPVALDADFQVVNELLDLRDPELFEKRPSGMLDAFVLMEQHTELKGMTAQTLRALWRNKRRIDHRFRGDPANRARFMSILRQPRGITHELRRMNEYGLLGRYIPAFGRIVGQMQHDLFHVYTVDEHILMVVRNLRRFTEAQHAHEYPLCSRLIADFERKEALYLAALFHDIAKGRGGDHSEQGAVDARRFCRAHGLSEEDGELVEWLVAQHLMMSHTAQKLDVTDPTVIQEFARKVRDERHLTALYLLTVADIRGTSPKVWNVWKARLLEDLFRQTRQVLAGQPGAHSVKDSIYARQQDALRLMQLYGLQPGTEKTLWSTLDQIYFQRHTADEIAWHARHLYRRVGTEAPVVKARTTNAGEGLQVVVYVPDQRDLFLRICSFFGRIHFSIVDAKVYTSRTGYALDTFTLLDPTRGDGNYRDVVNLIEFELGRRLSAQAAPDPLPTGRISRHLKHFPLQPEIRIFPDDKGQQHILEIVAGDRPGLLARIAQTLTAHHISVHSAKINTLGDRAEDVFLIAGPGLHDEQSLLRLETALLQNLRM
jgi:[protein-PII] uridylyltransferase